jgi:hypothetical protein
LKSLAPSAGLCALAPGEQAVPLIALRAAPVGMTELPMQPDRRPIG